MTTQNHFLDTPIIFEPGTHIFHIDIHWGDIIAIVEHMGANNYLTSIFCTANSYCYLIGNNNSTTVFVWFIERFTTNSYHILFQFNNCSFLGIGIIVIPDSTYFGIPCRCKDACYGQKCQAKQ